jgi:hypothetical protein
VAHRINWPAVDGSHGIEYLLYQACSVNIQWWRNNAGSAVTAKIETKTLPVLPQGGNDRRPHARVEAIPMSQKHRRAIATEIM